MSIDHHLDSGTKELERNERSWIVIAQRIAANVARLPELLRLKNNRPTDSAPGGPFVADEVSKTIVVL